MRLPGFIDAVGAAIHGFPMAWTIILSAYLVFLLHDLKNSCLIKKFSKKS
jgi:hypothetical protein